MTVRVQGDWDLADYDLLTKQAKKHQQQSVIFKPLQCIFVSLLHKCDIQKCAQTTTVNEDSADHLILGDFPGRSA